MKYRRGVTGFTLIELLVVIAIIGILASVVMLAVNRSRAKSRDSKRMSDISSLATAIESYFTDYHGYPATLDAVATTYNGPLPTAPIPADGTCGQLGSNPNTYSYTNSGSMFLSPKDDTTEVYPGFALQFCLGEGVGVYQDGLDANEDVDCTLSPNGITCQ